MASRSRSLALLLVVAALSASACADDPADPALMPDDASLLREGGGAAEPVTLMTRNLYLGTDFALVLAGQIQAAVALVSTTYFPLRAPALVAEIMAVQPDLIGLQEVSTYQFSAGCPGGAGTIDFLGILVGALGGAYAPYYSPNLSVQVPAGGTCVITYTDADAILVRQGPDVMVYGSGTASYGDQVSLPSFGGLQNLRGYQWVDVSVDGQRLHFLNTHLEVQQPPSWGAIQELQAAELLAFVDQLDGPVFMVGDFNSAANPSAPAVSRTATYGMILEAGFDDLWRRHNGHNTDAGLTCCQLPDLSNVAPDLDQRIDFIFARNVPSGAGFAGGVEMDLVGEEAADGYVVFNPLLGMDVHLWPSDHAGVHATLWMPPGVMAWQ
jgi:endonuclease/exonuclease/phosphatase family metal-dependent hydrolase